MKQVHETLDRILPEIIAMSEDIYRHPELGFKEFRTREKTIEALDKAGIPHEDVAYTGIRAVLDSGKPGPNIGLITEFDAVPTFGHPYASEDSYAAHTCGHYGQLGVMMSLFLAIKESGMLKDLCGKVTLLVTPAEEFCDMDYRKELIRGKDLPPIRKTGNDRHRRVRRCGSHAFLSCNGDRHDKISCGDRLQLKRFHHETRDLYWKGGACGRKSGRWCKCIKCSQSRNDRNQLPARDIPR